MTCSSYGVGWYKYTPAQLEELFPDNIPDYLEYREEVQYIVTFGSNESCWGTLQEAQSLLESIIANNSDCNLKLLTPLGADGLFIVKLETVDLQFPKPVIVKLSRL